MARKKRPEEQARLHNRFTIKDVHAVMVPENSRSGILKQFPDLSKRLIRPR